MIPINHVLRVMELDLHSNYLSRHEEGVLFFDFVVVSFRLLLLLFCFVSF